jgi:hypothetical protein
VTAPYDHEALWAKAKVFLNRAMDPGPDRSFDEQALWASAALELLAKAALARVSPLLIAEPTEEGLNILIAAGLVQGNAQFTSVSASTVFKRCERAFEPFSATEAMKFAAARNEYVHGSGIGFMAIPPQAWWPRYLVPGCHPHYRPGPRRRGPHRLRPHQRGRGASRPQRHEH